MKILYDFKTIVIDPPWPQRGGGKIVRGAQKHYKLLDTPSIIEAIVTCPYWQNVANDAHMYLWAPNNHVPDGLRVMEALGFRYITNVCWAKNSIGLGQYFRGKHELVLFGTRGRGAAVRTDDRTIPSLFEANKTTHSQKPDAFYEMATRRSDGPYLDIFARSYRPGWTVWGDELPDVPPEGDN